VKRKLSKVLMGGLFLVHAAIVRQPLLGLSRPTLLIIGIALLAGGFAQEDFDDGIS
jgi:hypothetical protein